MANKIDIKTVGELKEFLSELDDNSRVWFSIRDIEACTPYVFNISKVKYGFQCKGNANMGDVVINVRF